MKHRIKLKELLFVLPVLVILLIFSVYSIVQTAIYSLFDYQLNDPLKAGLYLNDRFNVELFEENLKYVKFFAGDDSTLVTDEQSVNDFKKLTELSDKGLALLPQLGATDNEKTVALSASRSEELRSLVGELKETSEAVYGRNPDVAFYNREGMASVLASMDDCFIVSNFIGVNGYVRVLRDTRFWNATWNTVLFTLISVSCEFVLGLALAMVMNKAIKGIGGVRTAALIPWAIPTVVSALIWSYLYDGSSGIISFIVSKLGLIEGPEYMLLSAGGAMASAILSDVWKTTPYMALLLLAGLQTIDKGLYESARIDGATKTQQFFRVTLPLLKPAILVALLFRTLDAFRVYDLIAVLTNGGPGGATETLSIYAYKNMFAQTNFGYGSVVVIMMFILVAIIAVLFIKVLGAEVIGDD
ncbi:MAG: carbohydrate ABC transporter permease [Burkholderiales bacterium]